MALDPPAPLQSLPSPSRDGPIAPPTPSSLRATNPLSSKVTSVLSTSYADSDFRDALLLLDERGVANTAETRRKLRLDLQKELIDSNGEIITEFGKVAEVSRCPCLVGRERETSSLTAAPLATTENR